jgi:hypothetical protein
LSEGTSAPIIITRFSHSSFALTKSRSEIADVFSLLAEARQRIVATITAIEAKRDFWLATVDLKAAIAGGGRSGNRQERANPPAASVGAAGGSWFYSRCSANVSPRK